MKTKTIAAALLAIGLAGPLQAGVVFEGGAPDQQNGLFGTVGLFYAESAATKFELEASRSFRGINWWGGYQLYGQEDTGINLPDLFTFQLFRADGDLPGELWGTFDLGTGNRSATGNQIAGGLQEYAYSATFDMTTLEAGTYFAALSNTYGGEYNWFWETTSGGPQLGTAVLDADFGWQPGTDWAGPLGGEVSVGGLAFQFVPEPGSLALLALALSGLAVSRQRLATRPLRALAI